MTEWWELVVAGAVTLWVAGLVIAFMIVGNKSVGGGLIRNAKLRNQG